MKHFSEKEWKLYITDLVEELKREELENHLFSCDQCLKVYMELLETQGSNLPTIQENRFTDQVVAQLPKPKQKRKTIYQHPLFHYGVAAVITIVLMTSGFFQSITGFVASVEASSMSKPEQTISNSLMQKTLSLFDKIDVKQKEGN